LKRSSIQNPLKTGPEVLSILHREKAGFLKKKTANWIGSFGLALGDKNQTKHTLKF
jgi:hypothetical protein